MRKLLGNRRAFTLAEAIFVLWFIFCAAAIGAIAWAAVHFISKFW